MALDSPNLLSSLYEPYTRDGKAFWRVRHDTTRSPRLEFFRRCVGDAPRGHRYRTGNASTAAAEVRLAFRQAVRECAAEDKAYPSDARYERRIPDQDQRAHSWIRQAQKEEARAAELRAAGKTDAAEGAEYRADRARQRAHEERHGSGGGEGDWNAWGYDH